VVGLADDLDAALARKIDTHVPAEKVILRDEAARLRHEVVDHLRTFEDVLKEAGGGEAEEAGPDAMTAANG
jgi:hypothetical protein